MIFIYPFQHLYGSDFISLLRERICRIGMVTTQNIFCAAFELLNEYLRSK